MKSPEFRKTSDRLRQNNKLCMVTPCYDMESPELYKISDIFAKITSYGEWPQA